MKKTFAILLSLILSMVMVFTVGCKEPEPEVNGTVSLKYYESGGDMLPILKQGNLSIGLLPEPAATQITKMASDKTWFRLDVQELYDNEKKSYPQAVMLVKQSLLNTYPNLVNEMSSVFNANVDWAKNNVDLALSAISGELEKGVTPTFNKNNLSSSVVDGCKIYWQSATEAKSAVKSYIDEIIAIEPISGKAVSDDFFYNGEALGEWTGDTVKVVAPDGAPALSIAKFIYNNENFGTGKEFDYGVVKAGDIGSYVQKGKADIVIIPVNAASKLYKANENDSYKLVSVITHGNLYLMSTEKINNLTELKDKTVGVIGKGLVPDLTFKTILKRAGMEVKVAD